MSSSGPGEGAADGFKVLGAAEGELVGLEVGKAVGLGLPSIGEGLGTVEGTSLGLNEGAAVGTEVGSGVPDTISKVTVVVRSGLPVILAVAVIVCSPSTKSLQVL